MLMELQPVCADAKTPMPLHAQCLPVLEPLHIRSIRGRGPRIHEKLHFHQLELGSSKYEVPWRDLVAKCLANLRDPEWDLLPRRLLDVEKVDVDPLRSFRTQIDDGRGVLDRTHERLEHQIEQARLAQRPLHAARRTLRVGGARRALDARVVGTKALLAVPAIDQRVGDPGDMAARLPYARMHENRGVQPLDVVARADERVPPAILDVALQLDAEGAVVPDRAGAAVDLRRLKD